MKATGLFFLCGRPAVAHEHTPVGSDALVWIFPLVERTKRGVQKVTAYWRGSEADLFVHIHDARLKPGQALNLELDRVRPVLNELTASVTSCALAPDRWPKTEVDATAAPTSQQPQRPAA